MDAAIYNVSNTNHSLGLGDKSPVALTQLFHLSRYKFFVQGSHRQNVVKVVKCDRFFFLFALFDHLVFLFSNVLANS